KFRTRFLYRFFRDCAGLKPQFAIGEFCGTESPWPEEEAAVARSCPWASPPNIVAALETTGGRGDDAIELLIATRNEPGLEEEGVDNAAGDKKGTGKLEGGGDSGEKQQENGRPGEGKSRGGGVAKKSEKAAKKVARASDCPCGSGLKYKKCCRKKDAAIARGQIAAPAEPDASGDSLVVDDLGSLVI
ncbi:unnamed protein product, partial [Ectocarpus fasciculatus]